MDNLFKPENPEYVPLAIPRVGVRMEFQRANLVVRDESGKELWMGPVVVERVLNEMSFGVVMSASTAENMLAAVAADAGFSSDMYRSMLVHHRESPEPAFASYDMEEVRLDSIRKTAESLAAAILQADENDKPIRFHQWDSYYDSLKTEDAAMALEVFGKKLGMGRTEGLYEYGSKWKDKSQGNNDGNYCSPEKQTGSLYDPNLEGENNA